MLDQQPRSIGRTDWLLIGLLLALVLPLRVWLLHNTEVAARDSIGYIRYALQFERKDWKTVLLANHQHPGYPVMVLFTSLPIRAMEGATTPENMALSAQLVSLAASLVLLIPCYFLGLQLFERRTAFFGALLFQYLPISAQHLSDGISEPFYLVLLVSGLLQAVRAIRERSVWHSIWCGVFTGLAYLTRPEGALILPTFGLVLLVLQCRAESRWGWMRFLACGAAMSLSALLVGSIYVYATGQFSNKPSTHDMVHAVLAPSAVPLGHQVLFAKIFEPSDQTAVQLQHSAGALFAELNQGFHYVAFIPAVLGFCLSFGSLRRNPGYWVVVAFAFLHACILMRLATVVSYVSDRHVMILVLLGCYFVAYDLYELPRRLLGWLKIDDQKWYGSATVWFAVFFLAITGLSFPKATQRLHGNRAGNRVVGLWLAKHVGANDMIEDDHSWSNYYSGLMLEEGKERLYPRDHQSKLYVVTTRSRDPQIDAKRQTLLLAPDAHVVHTWPENLEAKSAHIVVYVQRRLYDRNPWTLPKAQSASIEPRP